VRAALGLLKNKVFEFWERFVLRFSMGSSSFSVILLLNRVLLLLLEFNFWVLMIAIYCAQIQM
jgi:hypothetical protein